ncbi:uncharacterized protein TRIADDRAFT_57961 [Trichoplax adhaerens]|uniref:Pop1 N-terminal domain-containing protein n=1 Tax=Trichoplax adhaerens TaxID=10228 RepID=B3S282_TRIAD|nr:hypothetical protein TRIADDRAFT_57961 [Trichoplax adhaerens]EDV23387.1 hypothetical protein TRIADDRAFT_57961 [Trichoplax adhaerens]|eukprot:XP_002114297.1 hypothetical protein TRIADDRAFT_57961 [Trichoplax adhaerens]
MASKTLDVKGFIESRVDEIKKMEIAVKTIGGSRSLFQTVSRRMRRRAASHNRKRLPKRLISKDTTDKTKPTATTKKKRRTSKKRNFQRKDNVSQWLETHIWHAKRMKMSDQWNFKIAEISCEKGKRAAYRACKNECTIQDISYYRCIEIKGLQQVIVNTFARLTNNQTGSTIDSMDYLQGGVEGCLELLDQITLINQQNRQDNMLEIDSHTADDSSLLRFSLRGPMSQSVLYRAFKLHNERSEIETTWTKLLTLSSTATLPRGSVLALNVGDPRLNRPILKKRYHNLNRSIVTDSCQSYLQNWSSEFARTLLWNPTIRKNVKEAKKPDHELNKLRMQIFNGQLELNDIDNKISIPVLLIQQTGATATLININNESDFINSGWDLILPAGWGMPFWLSLIYCGARAIGLQESAKQYLEQGIPIFPSDYPDTAAGCINAVATHQKLTSDYYLRPPAKRINYSKIGILSPFLNRWDELIEYWRKFLQVTESFKTGEKIHETRTYYVIRCRKELSTLNQLLLKKVCKSNRTQAEAFDKEMSNFGISQIINNHSRALVAVKIKMYKRGTPRQFCPICLPRNEDFSKLKDEYFKGNLDKSLLQGVLERSIIGYVSCGDYSHSVGYGCAVGYCSIVGLTKLFEQPIDQFSHFILIRDTKSLQYHFASLKILIF